MKILFITDAWEPQINGVVTALKKTILHLEQKGHTTQVVHPGLFKTFSLPFYPEIRIAYCPKKTLEKLLPEIRPDAIHIATEGPVGLCARNLLRKKNIPFTTAYHTHFPIYLHKRTLLPESFFFLYFRWFHNASARTIVSTQTLAETLANLGFHHLAVAPLGVDIDTFTCHPRTDVIPSTAEGSPEISPLHPSPSLGTPVEMTQISHSYSPGNPVTGNPVTSPHPIFVYLGRIATEKNVEDFLKLDLPGSKLLIGDGPDRKKLEKKYPTANFVGYKQGKDITEILCGCDVMVMPSQSETFGLVVLEGLACSLPVAAYPVMGPKDIITPGIDGYLDTDLTQASKQCLTINRAHCRETALRYDWEKATETFLSHLARIPTNYK